MLIPDEPSYQATLPNGFVIRTVATLEDLERTAQFNGAIHGPEIVAMTYNMFAFHPHTTGRDLVIIEDNEKQVIASLCLIPWKLNYGGIDLPACELGIVGTNVAYRGQGLNQSLMKYFWERLRERGSLLSIIQGIPYFYRQYGYEYAHLQLEGGWRLQPDQIPDLKEENFTFRLAQLEDIPILTRLYDEQVQFLDMHAQRGPEIWEYLLTPNHQPDAGWHDTIIVEDKFGKISGYFRLANFGFHENLLAVDEVSEFKIDAALSVLHYFRKISKERGKDGIRFNLPRSSGLVKLAQSLGVMDLKIYSWQVHVPNKVALLQSIAPLLETRLKGSIFKELTLRSNIDLYKEVIALDFENGKLKSITPGKKGAESFLQIPPNQFIPLVFGGQTFQEIMKTFPDAISRKHWRLLTETLFPKTETFFHNNY
jgi:hypothetical protein